MILGADSRKPWSRMDVLVMNAYQRYLGELCEQHGGPRWLCDNADGKLNVRVKALKCDAKEALERYEEDHADDKEKGVSLIPEFYDLDERPLASFRELYRQQKIREAAEADDD